MRKIILIGGIGISKRCVGGESVKNMNLLAALSDCNRMVIPVNLMQLKKHPWRSLKVFYVLLLNPHANVIISSSLRRGGWLIKLFYRLRSRRNICFIGTGCEFSKTIVQGVFNPKYFRNVNSIVVQGESMKRELSMVGLDAIFLPNFKPMKFLPALQRKDYDCVVRFIFLSRMNRLKGVSMIINCVRRLNEEGYDGIFVVDFYGPFEDKVYETEIYKEFNQLWNVRYKGILDMREFSAYEILAGYTVMLFPSFWPGEGFPGVLIDAMISGLPVIVSDWHFNPDIIEEGKTGVIIPNQNEDALYFAMKDVIENPEKYYAMRFYCQQQAKKYDTKNVINEEFLAQIKM